eukprot:GHVS01026642.1.p1 GENE.GHVS01026642.1~~GHVS01026642.1.p1  ORF type:complete len:788 (+),score=80.79 GHVS01026642.1:266-2629(+)
MSNLTPTNFYMNLPSNYLDQRTSSEKCSDMEQPLLNAQQPLPNTTLHECSPTPAAQIVPNAPFPDSTEQLPLSNRSSPSSDPPEHIRYSIRWSMLFMFSVLALLNNVICFTLSPVSHFSRGFFINATPDCRPTGAANASSGISTDVPLCTDRFHIYYLVQIFFFSYSLLSFISPSVCHSIGLRLAVVSAAWLQALGCILRWLPVQLYLNHKEPRFDGSSMFLWTLIGQAISGVSQAFFVNTVSQFSCVWFGDDERVLSTSIALNANTLGIAVIYATAPFLVHRPADIASLLWWVSASAIASALVASLFFLKEPPTPPSKAAHVRRVGPLTSTGRAHHPRSPPTPQWGSEDNKPITPTSPLAYVGFQSQERGDIPAAVPRDGDSIGGNSREGSSRRSSESTGDRRNVPRTDEQLLNRLNVEKGSSSGELVCSPAAVCTTPTTSDKAIRAVLIDPNVEESPLDDSGRRGNRRWTVGFTIEKPQLLTPREEEEDDGFSADDPSPKGEFYADSCLSQEDLHRESFGTRALSCLLGAPTYVASGCCWGWESISDTLQEVVQLFGKAGYSQLLLAFSLSEAIINCYSTEMSSVMAHQRLGLQPRMIAILGSGFIATCVIGSSIIGPIVDTKRWYKSSILSMLFLATLTAVAMCFSTRPHFLISSILILGLWIGPVQPVCIEAAVDVTFPLSENLAVGVMQLTGNIFSMALLPWFTYLGTTTYLMGRDLAWSIAATLLICSTFRGKFRRWRLEQNLPVSARSRAASLICAQRFSERTERPVVVPRVHGLLVNDC